MKLRKLHDGRPFDQLALATRSRYRQEQTLEFLEKIGYTERVSDTVVARGEVKGFKAKNMAALEFVYGFVPMEFEVLHYVMDQGPYWLQDHLPHHGDLILSHFGKHVVNARVAAAEWNKMGFPILQKVDTVAHTNPGVKDNPEVRGYRYVIVGTRQLLGADLKFIQRLRA